MPIKEFADKYIKAQEEAWKAGEFEALEKLEDRNVIYHLFAVGQETAGWEAHKQYILAIQRAIPGVRSEWQYLTGDGNVFALSLKMSGGRFTGQIPGLPPPTGKEVVVNSLFVFLLKQGKIVEAWDNGTITGLT